jgi:hypothetical protein
MPGSGTTISFRQQYASIVSSIYDSPYDSSITLRSLYIGPAGRTFLTVRLNGQIDPSYHMTVLTASKKSDTYQRARVEPSIPAVDTISVEQATSQLPVSLRVSGRRYQVLPPSAKDPGPDRDRR